MIRRPRPPTIEPEDWTEMTRPSPRPTPAQIRQAREPRRTSTPTPEETDLDRDVRLLCEAEDREARDAEEYRRENQP